MIIVLKPHPTPEQVRHVLERIEELGLVEYLADRFAVAGTPEDCIRKLERAVEAGASQFWMSVHFADKARFMRDWAAWVMPAFR